MHRAVPQVSEPLEACGHVYVYTYIIHTMCAYINLLSAAYCSQSASGGHFGNEGYIESYGKTYDG